jgi:hypothetical protein
VIHEHEEPWWNDDVNRGKQLIHTPELSGNLTNHVIWYQEGEMGERNENLAL